MIWGSLSIHGLNNLKFIDVNLEGYKFCDIVKMLLFRLL